MKNLISLCTPLLLAMTSIGAATPADAADFLSAQQRKDIIGELDGAMPDSILVDCYNSQR